MARKRNQKHRSPPIGVSTRTRSQRRRKEPPTIITPTEVFRLISSSQFLSIKELGRFLLFTSKTMANALYSEDELWGVLIQSRFSFSPGALRELLVSMGTGTTMGSKETFLSLFHRGQRERSPTVIRDLQYRPVDYKLIVNMFEGDGGRAILSRIIDGEDVLSFFQDGSLTVTDLDLPVGDCVDLKASVQILRMTDNKVLRLFQEQGPDDYDTDYIFFGFDSNLEFRDYDYSRRLYEEVCSDFEYVQGLGIWLDVTYSHSCDCGCSQNIQSLNLSAKLDTLGDIEDFSADKEVTFAHFLEEFYGWE